jgi:histidinol dehydrogenase
VVAQVEAQVPGAFHEEQIRQALTGPQSGILVVDTLETAVAVADAYAAEHLEVHTVDALATARRIRNAGAVFVGPHSPVPLGDYSSGSNHVLPTGGSARYSSGLNTVSFLRLQQLIRYTETGLKELASNISVLADAEGLPAHGEAVDLRFR